MMRAIVLILAVVAAAGCAGLREPAPMPGEWQDRAMRLQTLDQWNVRGRLAVKTDVDAFNGSMVWTQADSFVSFAFRGPLGVGGFRLVGNDQRMVLDMSNGDEWELTSPQAELRQRIGWSVPLTGMRFWMLALPDPATPADLEFDDAGFLRRLEQQGWVVTFDTYKQVQNEWLPHKLVVGQTGVRLRVAVDRWRLDYVAAGSPP